MIRFPAAVQTVPCKTGGKSGRQTKESKVSPGFYLCSTFFVCSFLLEIFFYSTLVTAWNGTVYGEEITLSGSVRVERKKMGIDFV